MMSLTAYRKSDSRILIDPDGTELPIVTVAAGDFARQISQELNIGGHVQKLTWLAGSFFYDEHGDGPVEITLFGPGVQRRPFSTVDTWAWALFGQATYAITGRVSVTAGVRYSDEQKDVHNTGGVYRLGTDVLAVPGSFYDFVESVTYHAWTPRVSVQLGISRDTFLYGSAARGFKSGGLNVTAPRPGSAYLPEFAWTYEIGIKRTMAHERVRLNAAMFYNDYSNLQVQTFVAPGVTAISNAAASTIKGAEIETAAAAWRGLQLAGHLAWLDAKYDRYDAVGPGDVRGDASGHRLNNAPAWSGSASTLYEAAPAEGWHVFARGDLQWQSRAFFTPFNTGLESQAPYGLLHLRAGLRPSSRRWEFSVYVRNVGNHEYVTGASFPNAGFPAVTARPGDPRLWGTEFTFHP